MERCRYGQSALGEDGAVKEKPLREGKVFMKRNVDVTESRLEGDDAISNKPNTGGVCVGVGGGSEDR